MTAQTDIATTAVLSCHIKAGSRAGLFFCADGLWLPAHLRCELTRLRFGRTLQSSGQIGEQIVDVLDAD
jgi:hypothetical protein